MQANQEKVSRLIKTARGQLDGILKMIEENRYCIDIANQLMASEAILKRATKEILAAHMAHCVKAAVTDGDADEKINEIIAVIDRAIDM